MSGFPYKDFDGLGLTELVRKKEVHPKELVEEAIRRIEALNPELNAVINTMYEQARNAADREPAGTFAGVPMLFEWLAFWNRRNTGSMCAGIPSSRWVLDIPS